MSDHAPPLSPALFGLTDGDWLPVTSGESGALVFRDAGATRYAKCVPAADVAELTAERDRIAWFGGRDLPGPGCSTGAVPTPGPVC